MTATAVAAPAAAGPLAGLLRQLFDVVAALTAEEYARKPVGVIEGSVGGHVRHNLDHVAALLRGLPAGAVDYDRRGRDTDVERDRSAALGAIRRLEADLLAFRWDAVPDGVTLTALVAPDLPPVVTPTTADRELAFVVSHTVHHNALIAVMLKLLGRAAPAGFGYAPSTALHQRSRPCVR